LSLQVSIKTCFKSYLKYSIDSIKLKFNLKSQSGQAAAAQSDESTILKFLNDFQSNFDRRMGSMESALSSRMDSMESKMDSMESALSSRMDSMESKVDSMESKVDSMESALSSRMDSMESKMDSMESALSSRMDSMESKVDSMDTKISVLSSRVDSMESKVDSMDTKISVLSSRVDSMESAMEQLPRQVHTFLHDLNRHKVDVLYESMLSMSICESEITVHYVLWNDKVFGLTVAHTPCFWRDKPPHELIPCKNLDVSIIRGCPPVGSGLLNLTGSITVAKLGDDVMSCGFAAVGEKRCWFGTVAGEWGTTVNSVHFTSRAFEHKEYILIAGASQDRQMSGSAVLNGYGSLVLQHYNTH
jgi:peptidoglycan hydrolase CwlO-like protein